MASFIGLCVAEVLADETSYSDPIGYHDDYAKAEQAAQELVKKGKVRMKADQESVTFGIGWLGQCNRMLTIDRKGRIL